MDAAQALGARIIRVFSFWRTSEPRRCFPAIVDALRPLCDAAAARGLQIGLENEFACNAGTAEEAAAILEMLPHPALGLIWDPANMAVLGGMPFPDGYSHLPVERLLHVHVKDCTVDNFVPTWQRVGTNINWSGQIAALIRDGYTGSFSLETHWRGEHGDRLEASRICGRDPPRPGGRGGGSASLEPDRRSCSAGSVDPVDDFQRGIPIFAAHQRLAPAAEAHRRSR